MIEYDRTAFKGLIVSPTGWTAVPPIRWFDNFAIITARNDPKYGKAMHSYGIIDYLEEGESIPKKVNEIYQSPAYGRVIESNHLQDYTHILSRTRKKRPDNYSVLINSYEVVAKYESKTAFRKEFSSKIRMPKYEILDINSWQRGESYSIYKQQLAARLVLQHPDQSGGRGTYFVSSSEEFDLAVEAIISDPDYVTSEIVVSELLTSPAERSLQICILEDAILVGPPQAQLVRHPLLTLDAPDAIQFCGGRIGFDLMAPDQYEEASAFARTIAAELQQAGYRGIFGIDYLITDNVYVIEANLRFTGLSTLLASLQTEIPYMLLHILEHAKQEYTLLSADEEIGEGSFITIYAQHAGSTNLTTGLYDVHLNRLGDGFENTSLLPDTKDVFFVAMRVVAGESVKPGKSLAFVYSRTALFDTEGELTSEGQTIAQNIQSTNIAF